MSRENRKNQITMRMAVFLGVVLIGFFALTTDTLAANKYWVGTDTADYASASSWSSTNPSSCSGNVTLTTTPTSADVAIFDGDCDNRVTVGSNWTVGGLTLDTGYAGTVAVTGGYTLTSNGAVTFTAGNMSGALSAAGTITYTAGDISALNLTVTGSTVVFTGSPTIASLTINKTTANGLRISTGSTLTVTGDATFTDGYFNDNANYTGTLDVKGNVTVGANFDSTTAYGTLKFGGTGAQSLTVGIASWGANINVAKSDGTLTLINTPVIAGEITFTSGTVTGNLTVQSANIFYTGTANISALNLTVTGSNSRFDPNPNTSVTIASLTVNKNNAAWFAVGVSDTLIVTGDIIFTNGYWGDVNISGTLDARNNVTVGADFDSTTAYGTLKFGGTGAQSLTVGIASWGANINVAKSDGTLTLINTPVIAGEITFTSGTVTGNLTVQSNTITYAAGDLTALNLTVSGTASSFTGSPTIATLTVNKTTANAFRIAAASTLTVNGDVNFTDGYFNASSWTGILDVKGNVTVGANFDSTTPYGSLKFSGDGNQNFTLAPEVNYSTTYGWGVNIVIDKPSGIFNFVNSTTKIYGNVTFTRGAVIGYLIISGGNITYTAGDTSLLNLTASGQYNRYVYGSMTVASFTVDVYDDSCSSGCSFYLPTGNSLTVNGTTNFTNGTFNNNGGNNGILYAKGDVVVGNSAYNNTSYKGNICFTGTENQTYTVNLARWDTNITVTKTSGTITLNGVNNNVTIYATNAMTIPSGVTLDLVGNSFTYSAGYTMASGATLKLQGGNTTVTTPTLNSGSTVYYNGTSGPYTMKDWTYSSLTIGGGANSVFTLPASKTIATTTITTGILSLNGYSLTTTGFSNDGTLRMIGSETVSITNPDTDSGITEYVGDGDSAADTFSPFSSAGSYSNPGGSGDRSASISINTDLSVSGANSLAINGSYANNYYWAAQAAAGKFFRFDFGAGNTRIMSALKLYQNATYNHGAWRMQGTNGTITYSTGNRTSSITGSTNLTLGAGSMTNVLNGSYDNVMWWTNQTVAGKYIRFDFGAGNAVNIGEIKMYQNTVVNHGIWKVQGSNNGSDWTDIGSSFTLNSDTMNIWSNTSSYRYYQLLGVSGNASQTPYIQEFEFTLQDGVSWTTLGADFTLTGSVAGTENAFTNSSGYRYYQLLGVSGNTNTSPYIQEMEFKMAINSTTVPGGYSLKVNMTDTADILSIGSQLSLRGSLTQTSGTISAASTALTLNGDDQTISLSATTTLASLSKVLGVGSTTNQILYFSNSSTTPLIITGTTTLSGVTGDGLTLKLRSVATGTSWYFDPQATSTRSFAYLDVQDSTNINATEIDSGAITGFVDSGNNIGWGSAAAILTIGKSGQQIATTTAPVIGQDLGGAFTLNSADGDSTITSITLRQVGSVATTSLSNITLVSKAEVTCSTTTPASGTTPFGSPTNFVDDTVTITGSLTVADGVQTCLYVNYDLGGEVSTSTMGRSIDLEITNPVTDIILDSGTVNTTTRVNITDRTIITTPEGISALLSLNMRDDTKNPTLFYLQNDSVWKKEGEGEPRRLTNPNLKVHSLEFLDLTGANSGGTIKMFLTISNVDPGAEESFLNVTRTYSTTATVRAWGGND